MKVRDYGESLGRVLRDISLSPPKGTALHRLAREAHEMAEAYLMDGRTFLSSGDLMNGLAAFTYASGWLDASSTLGLFATTTILGIPVFPEEASRMGGERLCEKRERYGKMLSGALEALECSPDDLEWELGRWFVKGDKERGKTIQEIALLSHGSLELPEGIEGHLDATAVYNPPNLTYPYGCYICVVDVDPGTGQVKVRRFIAVDDCGPRINPTIVEGQIHGGLVDGIGMALMESIAFDTDGNCLGGSFMDYLLPTAMEVPTFELGETVTPSPHHPLGCKGVGESATVGSPAAVVNAVMDALKPYGVRHADMPLTPAQVWMTMQGRPFRTDLAIQ